MDAQQTMNRCKELTADQERLHEMLAQARKQEAEGFLGADALVRSLEREAETVNAEHLRILNDLADGPRSGAVLASSRNPWRPSAAVSTVYPIRSRHRWNIVRISASSSITKIRAILPFLL